MENMGRMSPCSCAAYTVAPKDVGGKKYPFNHKDSHAYIRTHTHTHTCVCVCVCVCIAWVTEAIPVLSMGTLSSHASTHLCPSTTS